SLVSVTAVHCVRSILQSAVHTSAPPGLVQVVSPKSLPSHSSVDWFFLPSPHTGGTVVEGGVVAPGVVVVDGARVDVVVVVVVGHAPWRGWHVKTKLSTSFFGLPSTIAVALMRLIPFFLPLCFVATVSDCRPLHTTESSLLDGADSPPVTLAGFLS